MLAYRHAFHAGNHADVLKHVVLVAVLDYLVDKAAPLTYIDTHAGAGGYALDSAYAKKNAEYRRGAQRVVDLADDAAPLAIKRYVTCLRDFNGGGPLAQYPGSPAIASQLLKPKHAMRLFERHPTDERILASYLGSRINAQVSLADGFASLARELPPPGRRGLVLIDPSYELKADYTLTVAALREALRRFATGTYVVWYPKVATVEATQLPRRLLAAAAAAPKGWLHAHLTVGSANAAGFGLLGSGVVVVNPPFTLEAQLREALAWLAPKLTNEAEAGMRSTEAHAPRFAVSTGGSNA
jgi:23S rRNA (adenine2030-N6)-methyltransferase